jgi:hypothetical protein
MKTSELCGVQLDYAVAKCEGEVHIEPDFDGFHVLRYAKGKPYDFFPSTNWAQGGLIIQKYIGNLWRWNRTDESQPIVWCAVIYKEVPECTEVHTYEGPTPLIAAMRCLVASKLGDEVNLPEEIGSI